VDLSAQAFTANPLNIALSIQGQIGQDCTMAPDCTDQSNPQASGCGRGRTKVGWERGNCGVGPMITNSTPGSKLTCWSQRNYGHSICCPTQTAPSSCIWRGNGLPLSDGGDCNGQCHEGEVAVFDSKSGGSPTEGNQYSCGRGLKQFCCKADDFKSIIQGCYWTKW
jgi:chitinase